MVPPDDVEAVLGKGVRLHGISVEVVPNGVWPLDFGGPLGDPVTRGIEAKLPWLNGADNAAGRALTGCGIADRGGHRSQAGFHAQIAMQDRAAAWHIDPARAGRHDPPEIGDVRLEAMQ